MTKPLKDKIYLAVQISLFISFILPINIGEFELSHDFTILFRLIAFIGIAFTLLALLSFDYLVSPFPTPKESSTLKTTGVYQWSRHPIYTGLIVFFVSWALANQSIYQVLIALIFLGFIYFKARYEETLLSKKFNEYTNYKKKTRMFI